MSEVSALEVGQQFITVYHRLRRLIDDAMTAAGLSLSRAKVLGELSVHGPMNQTALAGRLGFAPRSVTDTLDSLERDGLAERSDDPSDRRARIVAITAAGAEALATAMTTRAALFDQIFGALDAPSRSQLLDLLRLIEGSLTSPSGGCSVG